MYFLQGIHSCAWFLLQKLPKISINTLYLCHWIPTLDVRLVRHINVHKRECATEERRTWWGLNNDWILLCEPLTFPSVSVYNKIRLMHFFWAGNNHSQWSREQKHRFLHNITNKSSSDWTLDVHSVNTKHATYRPAWWHYKHYYMIFTQRNNMNISWEHRNIFTPMKGTDCTLTSVLTIKWRALLRHVFRRSTYGWVGI